MSKDEFTKLFVYMEEKFGVIETKLENMATKDDINRILKRFDGIEKQIELDDDERIVMGHQLERLDKWVHGIAKKIGYDLPS